MRRRRCRWGWTSVAIKEVLCNACAPAYPKAVAYAYAEVRVVKSRVETWYALRPAFKRSQLWIKDLSTR